MSEEREKVARMVKYLEILKKKPEEVTYPIFHYCPMESFVQIVKSGEIWASHHQSMNDYLEGRMFHQLLIKESSKYVDSVRYPVIVKFLENWELNLRDYFMCCFSKRPDVLSQWYMYADQGRGVCIGFFPESFGVPSQIPQYSSSIEHNRGIFPVVYLNENQQNIAKLILDMIVDGSSGDLAPGVDVFSIAVKHHGFSHEEEVRIVEVQDFRRPNLRDSITGYPGDHFEFRTKNGNAITSYRKFSFKNPDGQITLYSLWLGPECQLQIKQLGLFLNRYRCSVENGIFSSDNPYTNRIS